MFDVSMCIGTIFIVYMMSSIMDESQHVEFYLIYSYHVPSSGCNFCVSERSQYPKIQHDAYNHDATSCNLGIRGACI